VLQPPAGLTAGGFLFPDMPFADSLARFNKQAVAHRAAVYGLPADAATESGPNIAHTPAGGTEVRFRAPFVQSGAELDFRESGVLHRVDAVVHVPTALGLSFAVGDRLTHIASGAVYRVWRISAGPRTGVIRLGLKVPSLSS